jgi:alanine dehydrogenase
MPSEGTLLLRRSDVTELLSLEDCIDEIEEIFRRQGESQVPAPGILAVKAPHGGLHVKAAFLPRDRNYVVAKLNTNFPNNKVRSDLPTIQGVIVLCDGDNGTLLALLDSIEVTIKRTAAATAVAAKYLARQNSSVATLCGCGQQGRAQLRALRLVLPLKKIYAFDLHDHAARKLAAELGGELDLEVEIAHDLRDVIRQSDVCVTCTTSREFFVHKEDVSPGTFISAVGADDAQKQEIDPALMAAAKVVADSREQCCAIGDTHHAIAQGLMRKQDVCAELAEIIAGRKPGRTNEDEIIIFDSTGVAIEDAVAAVMVYEKARAASIGTYFEFAA